MIRNAIPLLVFLLLAGLLGYGLSLDPKRVPSPLIDKPAPDFSLAVLGEPEREMSPGDLRGRVWVLNVWASWCVSCRAEHALIKQLAAKNLVAIIGLNYKDDPVDARAWLASLGDPYTASLMDRDGRVGIDWGVYGVPETFVIGKDGNIKFKQIGPVTQEVLDENIIPIIKQLLG